MNTTLTNDQITAGAAVLCTECGLNCQPGACVYAPSPQIAEKVELPPLPVLQDAAQAINRLLGAVEGLSYVDSAREFGERTLTNILRITEAASASAGQALNPALPDVVMPEKVLKLLNHIEDVVSDTDWEKIDPALWNAVTTSLAAQPAEVSAGQARQVANKAEVEPVARLTITDGLPDRDRMFIDGAKLGNGIHDLYATPPATTGASTARLEPILDRLADAIGGYSGGPFDKVQAIIDELRAAPDCGACPGDGSMCKSRCKVEEESPASTVLTDERIEALLGEILQLASNGASHGLLADDSCSKIVSKINSVKAAPCTNSDSWNCKYCPKTADCAALKDKRNFGTPVAAQAGQVAVPEGFVLAPDEPTDQMTYIGQKMRYDPANSIGSIYCAMLAAAPSPAKESK